MITIKMIGYPRFIHKLKVLRRDYDRIALKPALADLHLKFASTLKKVFQSSGGVGQAYRHGYTGMMFSNFVHRLGSNYLQEIQTTDAPNKYIMSGTAGQAPPVRIPYGVVEWAMSKLGKEEGEAWRIARAIAYRGIGKGTSPMLREYPVGASKFDYPEWMVKVENRYDIEKVARRVGELTVSYLEST